ncbi:MAG: hypothetical protein L0Z55_02175 [Planctomycetes bacterium]|nr:hypothetical protein [Planctomycetota bacterium]
MVRAAAAQPRVRALACGLAAAVLFANGCTYQLVRIEVGTPIERAGYEAVIVGESGRKEVLAALGPPDGIRYTAEEEILEYRSARHIGTDLSFVLPAAMLQPGAWVAAIQGLFQYFLPLHEPEEFVSRVWVLSFASFFFGQLVSLSPVETGSDDLLVLLGRDLRFDRVRIILDRDGKTVRAKAFEPAGGDLSIGELWNRTLLQEGAAE